MKIQISLFLAAFFLVSAAHAQVHNCASAEYLKGLDKKYPGLEKAVKNIGLQNAGYKKTRVENITIPVVVHIVYNSAAENLTDDYVTAQIDLLNKSYARLNADTTNLRNEFLPFVGPSRIRFILDQIIRVSTAKTEFLFQMDIWGNTASDDVKMTASGGSDAVAADRKLNLWVCDLTLPTPGTILMGYAYPPPGLPMWGGFSYPSIALDGVVIDYLAFGGTTKLPKGNATYGCKGKTAVHEVGHYLGLRHIWGDDDGACPGDVGFEDDGINDTPVAADENSGCNKNTNSCNQGVGDFKDMLENYMDYSAESCQNTFTKEQNTLMETVLDNQRILIRIPTKVQDIDFSANVSIYPNPATEQLNIGINNLNFNNADVIFSNALGQVLETKTLDKLNNKVVLNVENLQGGLYFVKIILDHTHSYNQKVLIQ